MFLIFVIFIFLFLRSLEKRTRYSNLESCKQLIQDPNVRIIPCSTLIILNLLKSNPKSGILDRERLHSSQLFKFIWIFWIISWTDKNNWNLHMLLTISPYIVHWIRSLHPTGIAGNYCNLSGCKKPILSVGILSLNPERFCHVQIYIEHILVLSRHTEHSLLANDLLHKS